MKYIRTKNGKVIDIHEYWSTKAFEINPDENYWVRELLSRERINKDDCKVFDTIEELCDEFVIYSPNGFDGVSKRRSDNGHLVFLSPINESQKVFFKEELKRNKDAIIYGAIWTDKGLIYVAKMNDKGELELL